MATLIECLTEVGEQWRLESQTGILIEHVTASHRDEVPGYRLLIQDCERDVEHRVWVPRLESVFACLAQHDPRVLGDNFTLWRVAGSRTREQPRITVWINAETTPGRPETPRARLEGEVEPLYDLLCDGERIAWGVRESQRHLALLARLPSTERILAYTDLLVTTDAHQYTWRQQTPAEMERTRAAEAHHALTGE